LFKRKGDATTVRINRSTIAALDVAPIATISWLTRANPMLDGETLLACLKAGEVIGSWRWRARRASTGAVQINPLSATLVAARHHAHQ
jgi:hypothetical protein